MSFEPYKIFATWIADQVNKGELSPKQLAFKFVERIDNLAPELNTHIFWDKDTVLRQLEPQLDYIAAAVKANKPLPLAGVPVVIKDNIAVRGQPLSCGSKILTGFHSPYDATVVMRLRKAGALFLGKANLDEFAMGSSNENSAYGPVRNPWNTKCVPGGSSGGSAAAVAAAMSPLALGSDTGGSVRQPASFCGVLGLKPSYGSVSRYGLVSYASSLDQIGPMARSIEDLRLLTSVLVGHDPKDATSNPLADKLAGRLMSPDKPRKSLDGIRIGLITETFGEGLDSGVATVIQKAIEVLRELGAVIEEVSLPLLDYALASYYIVATAEASSNLSRFDGVRYGLRKSALGAGLRDLYKSSRSAGFGAEVKQRIMLGTFSLSSGYYDAYYQKAINVRQMIRQQMDQALQKVDTLVCPTSPTTAFALGAKTRDVMSMYLSDIYTISANLGGHPALSILCGFDQQALPVGLQMIGRHFEDDQLLALAEAYEQVSQWNHEHYPRC